MVVVSASSVQMHYVTGSHYPEAPMSRELSPAEAPPLLPLSPPLLPLFVVYGKWLNLVILCAFGSMNILTKVIAIYIVSISSEKLTCCMSLWLKVSAKCPKRKRESRQRSSCSESPFKPRSTTDRTEEDNSAAVHPSLGNRGSSPKDLR